MEDILIANIIYRELFANRVVFLQNIGFLSLVNHSAEISNDGSKLRPPYKTIASYSLDQQFDVASDVVMAISFATGGDYTSSFNMYNNYISRNVEGNIFTIPHVLTLNLDDLSIIQIDDRLKSALEAQNLEEISLRTVIPNQLPQQSASLRKRRKYALSKGPGTFMIVLSSLLLLLAIVYVVCFFLRS